MSPEDSLNAYRKDQDLWFLEIGYLEAWKRSQEAATAREKERNKMRVREENLDRLRPLLWKLGRDAGMPFPDYIRWAAEIVQKGRDRSCGEHASVEAHQRGHHSHGEDHV